MTFEDTMRALEAAGSEQTRKTYRRHGAPEPMFGVSFAVLGKLQKSIRTDHALARKLWDSKNTDARHLATMVADPGAVTAEELERWIADPHSGFFCGLIARHVIGKSPHARAKALAWIKSDRLETAQAGWFVVSVTAADENIFRDDELVALLKTIESTIHAQPNRVREAMNYALIAIGVRNPTCQKAALTAAKRIGTVEVDHGDTACKTPDATAYILKAAARRTKPLRRLKKG
jgi:3-methyladenine DNA glycosylase AlkD